MITSMKICRGRRFYADVVLIYMNQHKFNLFLLFNHMHVFCMLSAVKTRQNKQWEFCIHLVDRYCHQSVLCHPNMKHSIFVRHWFYHVIWFLVKVVMMAWMTKNASFWPNLAVFCPISSHARWHLRHIRHQNTKTSLYKLSKNGWVCAFF